MRNNIEEHQKNADGASEGESRLWNQLCASLRNTHYAAWKE